MPNPNISEAGKKTRWKKGESGNKNGKPAGVLHSRTRLLRLLEVVVREENPITREIEEFTILEKMDAAQIGKALNGDISAWNAILDRLEGKPAQGVELSGKDGGPIETISTWVIELQPERDGSGDADNSKHAE